METVVIPSSQFQIHLESIGACTSARLWANKRTALQAWVECEDPGWLLWWITKDKPDLKMQIVGVTCEIARSVLQYVQQGDYRPLKAIEATEEWLKNPTEENLNKVRATRREAAAAITDNTTAAAYATAAAAYAAAAATYAAASAAAPNAAANAADYAADYAAAAATYAAAYAAAITDNAAAANVTLKKLEICFCNLLRSRFSCPWVEQDLQ